MYYSKNIECHLSQLCDKHGSDKGSLKTSGHVFTWQPHTYTDFYSTLFGHCRFHIKKVFECGLGTNNTALNSNMGTNGKPGASLRVWRDYFPNAHIFGVDIDKNILFNEERIQTFYLDQTDPSVIKSFWDALDVTGFDLMVDDGLHTYEAGICLFEHSISRLNQDGIYIIEDVTFDDLMKYQTYFKNKHFNVLYISLSFTGMKSVGDNLVVIRNL